MLVLVEKVEIQGEMFQESFVCPMVFPGWKSLAF